MTNFLDENLPLHLAERLRAPLPGAQAQAPFQPELSFGRHFGPAPSWARPAAVLALLYLNEGQWHLPLTLRPSHMIDHAGQVSFPGGTIEPGERCQDAALRELGEELGVDRSRVELLGELSSIYLFRSNFHITPWLAVDRRQCPTWSPNSAEVEALLEIPLAHLLDAQNVGSVALEIQGVHFSSPCYRWREYRIWGATCLILAEMVALMRSMSGLKPVL